MTLEQVLQAIRLNESWGKEPKKGGMNPRDITISTFDPVSQGEVSINAGVLEDHLEQKQLNPHRATEINPDYEVL